MSEALDMALDDLVVRKPRAGGRGRKRGGAGAGAGGPTQRRNTARRAAGAQKTPYVCVLFCEIDRTLRNKYFLHTTRDLRIFIFYALSCIVLFPLLSICMYNLDWRKFVLKRYYLKKQIVSLLYSPLLTTPRLCSIRMYQLDSRKCRWLVATRHVRWPRRSTRRRRRWKRQTYCVQFAPTDH